MRITNNTMSNRFIKNLNRNLKKLQKNQEQMNTGKAVLRPSDDPIAIGKIMTMKNSIVENEQYQSNISDGIGWTRTQDIALNDAKTGMDRIRELMIKGSSSTASTEDREVIRNSIKSEVENLVDTLNTNYDGRYVFAGQNTDKRPFEYGEDGLKYVAFEGEEEFMDRPVSREISPGVTLDLFSDGSKILSSPKGEIKDLGELFNKIDEALENDDLDSLSGDLLKDLDHHIDNVLNVRTRVGTIDNRLESAGDRLEKENMNLKEALSLKEDVDIVEKYMESMVMTTVYQASLSMGAKILQPSLLDYLR